VGDIIDAEVYIGSSWYDRADCVVLDYIQSPVSSIRLRDELRQLAPALYLGKAYKGRHPLIRFALIGSSCRR
jgi:hypothetical protein